MVNPLILGMTFLKVEWHVDGVVGAESPLSSTYSMTHVLDLVGR